MGISLENIKALRERTQAPMLECKKALEACDGDVEKSIDHLKKQGQIKAEKKSDRSAYQGRAVLAGDAVRMTLLEVNCETDFVSGGDDFLVFSQSVADSILSSGADDVSVLLSHIAHDGISVDEMRKNLIAKIGENVQIRRFEDIQAVGHTYGYSHGGKIAAIVDISINDETLGKDLAMHVAASAPLAMTPDAVPEDVVKREEAIVMERAQKTGNPEAMIKGSMKKFVNEMSLLEQSFIKDPSLTVKALLAEHNAQLHAFYRYEVGEGMAKEESNFVEEVMAQVKGGS